MKMTWFQRLDINLPAWGARTFTLAVFLCSLLFAAQLFAGGKTDETERARQNNEWILCVTKLDDSSMPGDKLNISDVITRKIIDHLSAVNYRSRVSSEYAYYEELIWARDRTAAARSLSAKQDERAAMIFRGDPGWRYRQNIQRVEAEIERLKLSLEEIENNPPLINLDPVFKLQDSNMSFSFPAAPNEGEEYSFCVNQRADAFLEGSIMDFHGRFFVKLRLYAIYTRSFIWEDSIIFSTEDLDSALGEITNKLIEVLSGNKPAAIAVTAQPPQALVLINQSFAGRGDTGVLQRAPGSYTITAIAPGYETMTVETDISPGEIAEISFLLSPVQFTNVRITSTSFLQGGLNGETPGKSDPDTGQSSGDISGENDADIPDESSYDISGESAGTSEYFYDSSIGFSGGIELSNGASDEAPGIFTNGIPGGFFPAVSGDISIGAGSVYHGALYVGEAPYVLSLPLNTLEYIELITSDGKRGAIVFETPDTVNSDYFLAIRTSVPPPKNQLERERSVYYWVWGTTWVTGIAAWIAYYTYTASDFAIRYQHNQTGNYHQGFYDDYSNLYNISLGLNIALGAAIVYGFYQIGRYLFTADKNSAPLSRGTPEPRSPALQEASSNRDITE